MDRRYPPRSVVWTSIPVITWLVPWIGHVGMTTSQGTLYDFQGPYTVGEDNLAFNEPLKIWCVESIIDDETWDKAVTEASEAYCHRMHVLCWDNCHSHVAMALNKMRFKGRNNWTMLGVFLHVTWHGRFISFQKWLFAYFPFMILVSLVLLLSLLL